MNRALPGALDMSAYAQLAQLHKPSDPKQLAAEIRRLRSSGLTPRDISVAVRVALDVVVNVLADGTPDGAV